jgi:hypothetical protein
MIAAIAIDGRPEYAPKELFMAKSKQTKSAAATVAAFPYTNKPGSLRKLLKEIPLKPRPPKFDLQLLKSWGYKDGNDYSMLRVLKAVNLLNDKNEPTQTYTQFMNMDGGAAVLGVEVKELYAPMFIASHKPYEENTEKLKNLLNIHSGGGDRSLELQMQTFKALCESASFEPIAAVATGGAIGLAAASAGALPSPAGIVPGQPIVNINLHIHLPENKSRRDYETIIEDIGRYIFGRINGDRRE